MATQTDIFDYFFKEIADSRVYDWPFMATPWRLLGIIVLYLYGIYIFLPSYMAERKPYSLKRIIAVYNIFQVVACSTIIYGIATSGWTTHYKLFGCQVPDFSDDKMAVRMASFFWWNMMLKMLELIETVFFVLRKKFNQVSVLHVYHHASTLFMGWLSCKYYAGGMISFTILINSFIHVLMYSYYLFASFGPEMQKKLESLKPKLTMLQMFQLCLIFLHTAQLLAPSCKIHNIVAYIYLPNIFINIAFFVKFYVNSYLKKKKVN